MFKTYIHGSRDSVLYTRLRLRGPLLTDAFGPVHLAGGSRAGCWAAPGLVGVTRVAAARAARYL